MPVSEPAEGNNWPRAHAWARLSVVDLLAGDPILLAFLVMGLGAGVGAVSVRGVSLGPAAALFVGLAFGAIDTSLSSAEGLTLLRELGLVLFTYTIGLASGPTFLSGLRRRGLTAVALAVALVAGLALLCVAASAVLDLSAAERGGLFAGATTNTPALQAATEAVGRGNPVVAYSLAYPTAVVAMLVMATLVLGRRLPLPATLESSRTPLPATSLVNRTVDVTVAGLPSLDELRDRYPGIRFSRVERAGEVRVATGEHVLAPGDVIVVVGPEPMVSRFTADTGRRSDRHLPLDRSQVDFRRVVVSNRRLAGRHLGDLDLTHRYGVVPTRIRRGDDDLVATDDFELELGDRVRVVGPTDRLAEAARFLGDSERRVGEVDALGFALGATLGTALGAATVHVGSIDLTLGVAGGPLVVGLVLGVISRTGPVTWQIPHGANQVLRQLGILMFLACAGLASGTAFADAVVTRHGAALAAAGAVVASVFAAIVPLAVTVLARRDAVETAGMLAGIETQPAALAYGVDRTGGDERVSRAYAVVFPAAMLAKVVIVQLLV
jgi:putative transport protein